MNVDLNDSANINMCIFNEMMGFLFDLKVSIKICRNYRIYNYNVLFLKSAFVLIGININMLKSW